MGAWGTGNLENDAALDWLGSFTLDPSVPRVRGALRAAIDEPEYLDADVCSEALAAAEAVAAALGRPVDDPQREELTGAAARTPALAELRPEALAAVDRAATPEAEANELYDLNDEAGSAEEWLAVLSELRARLQA